VFGYILATCLLAMLATYLDSRDPNEAILIGFLPVVFGFGLMSAIDYRADSIGAFAFLCCLFLLEINRRLRSIALSVASGAMAVVCAFMTQKVAAVGGVTIAILLIADSIRCLRGGVQTRSSPLIASVPGFLAGAALAVLVLLGIGAALGMLGPGYEITVTQALEHEARYPAHPLGGYLEPYLATTAYSTLPIVLVALAYLSMPTAGFWRIVLGVGLVGGLMVKAKFPYNYVYLSYLIAFCAVRGYAAIVRRLPLGNPWGRLRPLLYLLPLIVIYDQLGFVNVTSTNRHQLDLLDKIQTWSSPEDRFIDSAGGALFRHSARRHYYHGKFHQEIFADYFREELIDELRSSEALFWIKDLRSTGLPHKVIRYLNRHYIWIDGDLHALGFVIPAHSRRRQEIDIDVVREGDYHLIPFDEEGREPDEPSGIEIDGLPVAHEVIHLRPGAHTVTLHTGSRRHRLSLLPPEAFAPGPPVRGPRTLRHSMLFQFKISD
jgi:hypothetical protein